MDYYQQILNLFENDTEESFNSVAIHVFLHQAENNPIYKRYLELLDCDPFKIVHYRDIPLLPITFFKSESIKTGKWTEEKIFLSSGTTQSGERSRHLVKSADWYHSLSKRTFLRAGYDLAQTEILGLLPSYIENGDSSLVSMIDHFQSTSATPGPANFLYDFESLYKRINDTLVKTDKSITLIGVTYALIDFGEQFSIVSKRLRIMFTGGMKRKKKEMTYAEIALQLGKSFSDSEICSEFGMTEMFSQAYADDKGKFKVGPTLRILTKELQDPLTNAKVGKSGVVGIIDLVNIDTLSFIMTEDLGILNADMSFQILGRMEESDIRGCNLLYEQDYLS